MHINIYEMITSRIGSHCMTHRLKDAQLWEKSAILPSNGQLADAHEHTYTPRPVNNDAKHNGGIEDKNMDLKKRGKIIFPLFLFVSKHMNTSSSSF